MRIQSETYIRDKDGWNILGICFHLLLEKNFCCSCDWLSKLTCECFLSLPGQQIMNYFKIDNKKEELKIGIQQVQKRI